MSVSRILSVPGYRERQPFIFATYPRVHSLRLSGGIRRGQRRFLSYLVLLRVGFTVPPIVTRRSGELLPHLFTLMAPKAPRFVFCGTFRSRSDRDLFLWIGRAPCPVEFGLSSIPQSGRAAARHFRIFDIT